MGRAQDKKSTMTQAERDVVLLRIQNDRLMDVIAGQPSLDDEICGELELVLTKEVGYWRLGRARNGDYWVRWKWTDGPYKGHYEIGGHTTLFGALGKCLDAMLLVEKGLKSPPYDAPAPNVNKYERR